MESGAKGWWRGEQGEAVALTCGLIWKESSFLAGWVDINDSYVNQGVWGGRGYTAAMIAALALSTTVEINTGTHYVRLLNKKLLGKGFRIENGAT